jgi:hypothetical protein
MIKTEDQLIYKSDIYGFITMAFKYFISIKNIYHFKDLLSYCIPSLWYFKKRYNSPYNKTLKNSIFTLRWSNLNSYLFFVFLQKFEYCYNNGIQCKFHDFIDAENVITLSIL